MPATFDAFFRQATCYTPHTYQVRLACGEQGGRNDADWLASGTDCPSRLIQIPTGLGKTAAVVLAWLWNRVHLKSANWPRRLVYCLPMRTLVEQTRDEADKWLQNLGLTEKVGLHILMGGEDTSDWDLHPERDAVFIGTQDMLLSRALNRGYGMSRYRWPMHFGLLNNDCLWVMDEVQLMGPGLATACQLEAFRARPAQGFDSFGGAGSVTWYMSATTNPSHLETREWRGVQRPAEFEFGLTQEECHATSSEIHRRHRAKKSLELQKDWSFQGTNTAGALVAEIWKRHEAMLAAIATDPNLPARTLVICNTVDRAREVHALLAAEKLDGCDLLLLHSRFRPPERRAQMKRLGSLDRAAFPKGQIVVSTQVIEAGVDVSSGVLWSEVAPIASLVQRLGRLNRAGEFNESAWKPVAVVVGIKLPDLQKRTGETATMLEVRQKTSAHLPYDYKNSEAAWTALAKLNKDASPVGLEKIQVDIADSIPRCPYSLQRHELLDFFDTDANLSLGFTDVSPFVRGLDDDTDLHVLWRESWLQGDGEQGTGRPDFSPDYQRDELCPVPIGKALKARDILNQGWLWRGKESGWVSVRDAGIAPGMTILLPCEAGGYEENAGWTGDKADNKHTAHYSPRQWPSDEEQLSSLANGWQSIAEHTVDVAKELRRLLDHLLKNEEAEHEALTRTVPWHDIGKNHPGWQEEVVAALGKAGITGKKAHQPFAKFSLADSAQLRNDDGSARFTGKQLYAVLKKLSRYFQPAATHEVASALAFRQAEQKRLGLTRDADPKNLPSLLAEYLIMSHHGRVRKVLRDEIPRFPEDAKDTDTVRGIADGSAIPAVQIDGQSLGCASLSTGCRKMGRGPDGHESYTRCVLRLLDHYGPFRLAYFEALFRAADMRASKRASEKSQPLAGLLANSHPLADA